MTRNPGTWRMATTVPEVSVQGPLSAGLSSAWLVWPFIWATAVADPFVDAVLRVKMYPLPNGQMSHYEPRRCRSNTTSFVFTNLLHLINVAGVLRPFYH